MYIMSNESRYEWTHEIRSDHHHYQGQTFPALKRYSILFFEPGPVYDGVLFEYPFRQ